MLDILLHACAAPTGKRGKASWYRSFYVATLGSPEFALCECLVGLGLMKRGSVVQGSRYFHVHKSAFTWLKSLVREKSVTKRCAETI